MIIEVFPRSLEGAKHVTVLAFSSSRMKRGRMNSCNITTLWWINAIEKYSEKISNHFRHPLQ